jgi:hypothetical protein
MRIATGKNCEFRVHSDGPQERRVSGEDLDRVVPRETRGSAAPRSNPQRGVRPHERPARATFLTCKFEAASA